MFAENTLTLQARDLKAAGQTEEVPDGKVLYMMESNISRTPKFCFVFFGVESRELEVFSKVTNYTQCRDFQTNIHR